MELLEPNDVHYQNAERSLGIFFRSCICLILSGFEELYFCAKCEKVLLKQKEIRKGQDEIDHNSIQCDQCQLLQLKDAEALGDNLYCNLCLKSQEGNI